jgi:hypothetical protein
MGGSSTLPRVGISFGPRPSVGWFLGSATVRQSVILAEHSKDWMPPCDPKFRQRVQIKILVA